MTPKGSWEKIVENMTESCKTHVISYVNARIQVTFHFYSAKFRSCILMRGDITFKGMETGF